MAHYRKVLQHGNKRPRRSDNSWLWIAVAGAVAVIAPAIVAVILFRPWRPIPETPQRLPASNAVAVAVAPKPPPVPVFRTMVYPTPQTNLLDPGNLGFLQPTASGRPESGAYGSVRPGRFHEGIDIAATARNRSGHAIDPIRAVARGMVAHVNRIAGNSNYGIYVVLIHDDNMGEIYTLYAHLSEVSRELSVGRHVEAGTVLGTMGNTPVSIIPAQRSHLHFEIGMIANSRFRAWFLSQRLKPDHGMYNGWNLMAIDPIAVFAAHQADPDFSFRDHIRSIPRAFDIVISTSKQLDYFRRYPRLWEGSEFGGGPIVLSCSENGVPLSGRNAGEEEKKLLAGRNMFVLRANGKVLGANGDHLVQRSGTDDWKPGKNAKQWLDILTY